MNPYTPPVRPDLAGEVPYGAPQLNVDVRLNVNENPFAPPESVVDAVTASVQRIMSEANRYPDRDFIDLRTDLAAYLSEESGVHLSAEQLWAANGSNEVMAHVMAAFGGPGRTALTFPPTYSMYPEYARESFTTLVNVPRRSDFTIDVPAAVTAITRDQPSIVLVASPNNPTGTAIGLADIAKLASVCLQNNAVLVVDEAYAEFRRSGVPSALELLSEYPNVIVTRTMSKAFAMAGVRLGYAAAHSSVIDALRIVRLPYHLSSVTQAVARAAIAHAGDLQADLETLREKRDALVVDLTARGLRVAPSDANFAFFGVFVDRQAIWQGLVDRGVLIRETGPEGWLRVSVGTPEENARFITALDEVLADLGQGALVVDE
ncbi:MAG: histidinol-phosphate transaminase [Actinomycetota bacterium]|nr:histidinol-phosphate transaminase [Actinomycetota bacterium]